MSESRSFTIEGWADANVGFEATAFGRRGKSAAAPCLKLIVMGDSPEISPDLLKEILSGKVRVTVEAIE